MRTDEILREGNMAANLSTLVDLFVATKSTEGKSKKTTDWYQNMLGRFVAYVGKERHWPTSPLPMQGHSRLT